MIDYGKELQKAYDDGYKDRDAEIVRCKECKYYEPFRTDVGFCKISGLLYDNDWFCMGGKRKDG